MAGVLRWILHGIYVAFIALQLARLPAGGNPTSLDGAWHGLLQHDWVSDARFGVDTVFTYGPLGHLLTTSLFTLESVTARWYFALVQALVLAAALTSLASVLPRGWRTAYRVCVAVLAPFTFGSEVFAASSAAAMVGYLAVTAPRAAATPRADRLAWTLFAGSTALALAAGLAKSTHLAQAGAQFAVVAIVLVLARRPGAAAAALLVFATAGVGLWVLGGQSVGDLSAYLRGSSEIAAGYNAAMATYGHRRDLVFALVLLAANAALAVLLLRRGRGAAPATGAAAVRRWGGCALAAVLLLLTWKSGFVRHDVGHTPAFFAGAALAPFLLIAASGRAPGRAGSIVAATAILLALVLDVVACHHIDMRVRTSLPSLQQFAVDLERTRAENATNYAMPRLREQVGDEGVDLMGYEQGLLFAAGFRVRHRPVFQSYSAYTPYLQQLNADFFAREDAPRHVLAKVQAIDLHLPLTEDSQAWKVLFDRYELVDVERGVLLYRRQPTGAVERRRCLEARVGFDEWVAVPDDGRAWHELGLDIEYSALGRALGLLWRAGALELEVRTAAGAEMSFSIAPPLVRATFVLDPLVRSTQDLASAYLDSSQRVRAFRVRVPEAAAAHFDPAIGVRLDARPPPQPPEAPMLRDRLGALAFPSFGYFPYAVEPPGGAVPRGGEVMDIVAHAPCSMLFRWPGGKHTLAASFELPEGAYTGECHSDGATFRVEAGPASSRVPLFERHLQPHLRAEDRGLQQLLLDIDLPAGETVVLATGVGPSGHGLWDWSCWRGVRLDPTHPTPK